MLIQTIEQANQAIVDNLTKKQLEAIKKLADMSSGPFCRSEFSRYMLNFLYKKGFIGYQWFEGGYQYTNLINTEKWFMFTSWCRCEGLN